MESKKSYLNLIAFGVILVIVFIIGNCQGRKSGESDERRAWNKERKVLLNKADSIEQAAKDQISWAKSQLASSQDRERSALIIIKEMQRLDSLEDLKFKKELVYYRSYLKRPAKELQDAMIKDFQEYEKMGGNLDSDTTLPQ